MYLPKEARNYSDKMSLLDEGIFAHPVVIISELLADYVEILIVSLSWSCLSERTRRVYRFIPTACIKMRSHCSLDFFHLDDELPRSRD